MLEETEQSRELSPMHKGIVRTLISDVTFYAKYSSAIVKNRIAQLGGQVDGYFIKDLIRENNTDAVYHGQDENGNDVIIKMPKLPLFEGMSKNAN